MAMPPSSQPEPSTPEAAVTRLLWREQIRALPASLMAAVRRLLRREPRWYLVIDGRVTGRLVSAEDYASLLAWIGHVHGLTFQHGVEFGKGVNTHAVDQIHQVDAGEPGPA